MSVSGIGSSSAQPPVPIQNPIKRAANEEKKESTAEKVREADENPSPSKGNPFGVDRIV